MASRPLLPLPLYLLLLLTIYPEPRLPAPPPSGVAGRGAGPNRYLLDVGPGASSVQKRLLRQRVNCCVARAQAGVLLRRLKFALPGWMEAESRRGAWAQESAQRAAQARAFAGEGHSEEWGLFSSGSSH